MYIGPMASFVTVTQQPRHCQPLRLSYLADFPKLRLSNVLPLYNSVLFTPCPFSLIPLAATLLGTASSGNPMPLTAATSRLSRAHEVYPKTRPDTIGLPRLSYGAK